MHSCPLFFHVISTADRSIDSDASGLCSSAVTSPGHSDIKQPKCWCQSTNVFASLALSRSAFTAVDVPLLQSPLLPLSLLSLRGQASCDHLRLHAVLSIRSMALQADWGSISVFGGRPIAITSSSPSLQIDSVWGQGRYLAPFPSLLTASLVRF